MRRPNLANLLKLGFLILLIWVAGGIYFGVQHHVQVVASLGQDDLEQRLIGVTMSMIVWAVFTPFVLFIAERVPLRSPYRLRNTLLLVPICAAIAGARALIDPLLPVFIEGMELGGVEYRNFVLSTLHMHIVFVILLVGVANYMRLQREIVSRRRAEARSQAELAMARLRRLRAGLDPHFLFNALNAVAALVHIDPARAQRMLAAITDLLHHAVSSHDATEVRISEELAFVERYLDVQKTRFGDRFVWRVTVDDDALLEAAVPPLLLHSIVENAIVHGLSKVPNGGAVDVHVGRRGERLLIEVADTGPGSEPAALFAGKGIGISNAMARLELAYGGEYSLTFRREAGRFIAEVTLPLQMFFPESLAS